MHLRLIRNATLVLNYGGHRWLIDPYFAPRHSLPSFTGNSPNPLVELPIAPTQIVEGVEAVLVSHLHTDHFDTPAQDLIPKALPLFCGPAHAGAIRDKGFSTVTTIQETADWEGVHLTRIDGHHGVGEVGALMGTVYGFVFRAKGEPTVYWAGDTILCAEVEAAIRQFGPEVIIVHAGGATWPNGAGARELIIMDAEQVLGVCRLAPNAQVIATHMEALDHCMTSRRALHDAARHADISDAQLKIPADGEAVKL
jgi:L-ascorbate metabolism protein UlaG (beta-lactamase superfamily)